jgi:hypothetical protein
MQKPHLAIIRVSQNGSVLVAVMAFITLMTIAMGGFLGVARNIVNQEVGELNDDKAFLAAESGLMLGSRAVLAQYGTFGFASQTDMFGTSLRGANAIDEMDVAVTIVVDGSTVTVTSTAKNPSLLMYKKNVRWKMHMIPLMSNSGKYAVYLDNAYQLGGNTKGIRKMDWDGPAHFNTALQLGNPGNGNETHFNGPVTLFNIDPATNLQVFDPNNGTGHFSNDYRYGVAGGSGNWDSEFLGTYDPHSQKIVSTLNTTDKIDLTLNATDSNVTLGVNSGIPYYRYKNAAGNVATVSYDPNTNVKLHVVNKGVAVSGSVTGKVLIYTDPGKNIYLPGNLTYADFSTSSFSNADPATNSGYGMNSSNVMGLYSGADLVVAEGTHYITAQLFATTTAESTLRFESDKKNKTGFFLFGTLAVNGFWDNKQGNDQATFKQLWDRRALAAPGLGFTSLDQSGSVVYTSINSDWIEENIVL